MKPALPQSAQEGPGPPGSGPPPGPDGSPAPPDPARTLRETAPTAPAPVGLGLLRLRLGRDRPRRTGPDHCRRSWRERLGSLRWFRERSRADHCDRPRSPAFPSPRITLFLLFPNDLQWGVKSRADQQPDASNQMSFPPVSRDFSAGFGDEGEGRGPRVGDRCPGPRAFVDEEPGPRVPKPGMKPLLRRGGGRGLPWTRGRLGDGAGHRAPQPCRRPPPGGESYATRRTWGFSWRAPGRGPGNETHSCNGGRASRRGRDPGWSGSRTGRGCGPNDMRGQDAVVRVADGRGRGASSDAGVRIPTPIGSLAPHASRWTRWSCPAQWVVR